MWLSENSTCLGMGIEFVFFHRTEWITQTSCKPNTHTVAAQSSLTSSLFSNSVIHCVFIHCSSHSLLPPPHPHTTTTAAAPLCGLARGFHTTVADTMVALTQVIRCVQPGVAPCFSFHGWVKHPQERFQVNARAGVGTDKEKIQRQSSPLQPFRQRQSRAAPWQACSDTASFFCLCVVLFIRISSVFMKGCCSFLWTSNKSFETEGAICMVYGMDTCTATVACF